MLTSQRLDLPSFVAKASNSTRRIRSVLSNSSVNTLRTIDKVVIRGRPVSHFDFDNLLRAMENRLWDFRSRFAARIAMRR